MALHELLTLTSHQTSDTAAVSRESVKPNFSDLLRETLRGKSLHRTLQNVAGRQLVDTPLTGLVLDLAAGRNAGNYRRFLAQDRPHWISMDLNAHGYPTVQASMDASLPFHDNVFDSVVFYNGIYIADAPLRVLREVHRVLKPGGRLILAAPTIFESVPEPYDYWRFTGEGIEKLMLEADFSNLHTACMGGGRWGTAAYVLTPFLRPLLLRAMIYGTAISIDGMIDWVLARLGKRMRVIPIGYVALGVKPEAW